MQKQQSKQDEPAKRSVGVQYYSPIQSVNFQLPQNVQQDDEQNELFRQVPTPYPFGLPPQENLPLKADHDNNLSLPTVRIVCALLLMLIILGISAIIALDGDATLKEDKTPTENNNSKQSQNEKETTKTTVTLITTTVREAWSKTTVKHRPATKCTTNADCPQCPSNHYPNCNHHCLCVCTQVQISNTCSIKCKTRKECSQCSPGLYSSCDMSCTCQCSQNNNTVDECYNQ